MKCDRLKADIKECHYFDCRQKKKCTFPTAASRKYPHPPVRSPSPAPKRKKT